jgi:hypothetical protein
MTRRTTDCLPARRPSPRPAVPAPTPGGVLVGKVLAARTATGTHMIRNTEWTYLGRNQIVLNGPLGEIGQIVAILRGNGELRTCTAATASHRGAMVTATLTPPQVPGRTLPGKAPTVTPWTRRRKAIVFGAVLPSITAAVLVVALLWPLAAASTSAALALAAWLCGRYQRRHHTSNVPHVAIDHID